MARGRKPQGLKRPFTVATRLDADELRAVRIAAAVAGERVAEWVRRVLLRAASHEDQAAA